jgi:hypothetical protein
MIAIWVTLVLAVAALAAAMTLGFRRWSAQPVPARRVDERGCYPKVKR